MMQHDAIDLLFRKRSTSQRMTPNGCRGFDTSTITASIIGKSEANSHHQFAPASIQKQRCCDEFEDMNARQCHHEPAAGPDELRGPTRNHGIALCRAQATPTSSSSCAE